MRLILFTLLIVFSVTANSNETEIEGLEPLKQNYTFKIDKSGNKTVLHDFEFKVVTESGRIALTNYRTQFFGKKDNFKLLEVFSEINGVKTVTPITEVNISDLQAVKNGLSDLKQVIIPINSVNIGSRVKISYEITTPPFIEQHAGEILAVSVSHLAKEEICPLLEPYCRY